MPHFVVDCSKSVLSTHGEGAISEQVHIAANSTGLFNENNIQVRVNPFNYYLMGNKEDEVIHVFISILEGRTAQQKSDLSKTIVKKLVEMFPEVAKIGADINDIEKGTGFNRGML